MKILRLIVLSHNDKLGINKENESWIDIINKHNEESKEVIEAIENEQLVEIGEETLDQIQVCIGILDKLSNSGININSLITKHNQKLVNRGWVEKSYITIDYKVVE